MLNKERISLLAEDLRANPRLQGRGRLALKDTNGEWKFCCLGRACEVAMANGLNLAVSESQPYGLPPMVRYYNGEKDYLPDEVLEWYGFSTEQDYDGEVDRNPSFATPLDGMDLHGSAVTKFADANDAGVSFEVIAGKFEELVADQEN